MVMPLLSLIFMLPALLPVSANTELDALIAFKSKLVDPYGVFQSWNASHPNPCPWYHITCNQDDSVVRVDIGNAGLSGTLSPKLQMLTNLQYLELFNNNITGPIPYELGNLTNLVSLDLYMNKLTGPIPDTLGNLKRLRFLRLNNNSLTGEIPETLTTIPALQLLDLSYNHLTGVVPFTESFSFGPMSFAGNPDLKVPAEDGNKATAGNSANGAIARGVAALLVCAASAFALTWW